MVGKTLQSVPVCLEVDDLCAHQKGVRVHNGALVGARGFGENGTDFFSLDESLVPERKNVQLELKKRKEEKKERSCLSAGNGDSSWSMQSILAVSKYLKYATLFTCP